MKQTRLINVMIFLSVFISSITFFKEPFEGYFHYIIFLLLLPPFILKFGPPKKITLLLIIPLLAGVLEIFMGNNTWDLFLKIFIGVLLSVSFYGYVMEYFQFDTQKIFSYYLKGALIVSYIGLFQFFCFHLHFKAGYDYSWIFNKWGVVPSAFGIRINSVFSEASQCAIVLSPACFVALYNLLPRNKKYVYSRFQSVIIILATFLTTSSTGYMGFFLILFFLLLNYGKISYFFIGVPIIMLASFLLYNNVPDFKSRVDTSLGLWVDADFTLTNVNSSSFILYNNFHIAEENFLSNPFTGTGLGSHTVAFDKYSLTNREDILDIQFNKSDANSLFIRLLSETGLMGLGFFLVFMIRFFVRRNSSDEDATYWIISNATLIIVILYGIRQGNYF
ncbi:MAG TPA: O-antigen ligase family protein, partial [Bacteroidia bacterium]|nr:O-antigen ligase family protein [Bacteroidia bacterium]